MTEKLTYEDLNFPNYVNSREAMRLTYYENGEKKQGVMTLSDLMKGAEVAGGSFLNLGDTRTGKSQVMSDIHRYHFGGGVDNGGRSTFMTARSDFSSEGHFMTIDQSKLGEGKGMVVDVRVPVERRVKSLAMSVDEMNLVLPELQVEYFGPAEGRHQDTALGEGGYFLFMTAFNFSKVNGEFVGTSGINRALLNRMMFTFDHDRYRPTDEDKNLIDEEEASGRLKLAPIRDISEKVLQAYQEIKEFSKKREPWIDAYLRVLSSGLEYCDIDNSHLKKAVWPIRCGTCSFGNKDLCSLVKHSNTGTIGSLKKAIRAIEFMMKLKYGDKISVDPFDLVFETFKFTTYHGNLNEQEIQASYFGENQELMEHVVKKLRTKLTPIRSSIDCAVENVVEGNPVEKRIIKVGDDSSSYFFPYSEERVAELAKAKNEGRTLNFRIISPWENFGRETGIRMDWFPGYLESLVRSRDGGNLEE